MIQYLLDIDGVLNTEKDGMSENKIKLLSELVQKIKMLTKKELYLVLSSSWRYNI